MINNNILVTGGAGYIGSKIVTDLINQKYNVFIIDNLSTGYKSLVNKKAIFFKFNIGNIKKLNFFFKNYKIKSVIHCAASLNINESEKKPRKYFINNVINTKKLLKVASNYKIENFILSSTAAVYGKVYGKVSERVVPKPISVYGKNKLKCEILVKQFAKKYKFNYGILRYFNVAGSDMKNKIGCINDNNQLFKNITKSICTKKYKISIFGNNYKTKDGTCIRDFIHINDISKIHYKLLKLMMLKKKSYLLNCGYGKGYSIMDILNCFEKIYDVSLEKKILPRRDGDVVSIYSDINKLNKVIKINFNLKNTLIRIVKSSMEWEKFLYEK